MPSVSSCRASRLSSLHCSCFFRGGSVGAMGKGEHMFSHMINIGRFWMFSLYYVVSELYGSVSFHILF